MIISEIVSAIFSFFISEHLYLNAFMLSAGLGEQNLMSVTHFGEQLLFHALSGANAPRIQIL
jgi:hypothetical protein